MTQTSQQEHKHLKGQNRPKTLRKIVLAESRQDVYRCRACGTCTVKMDAAELDVSIESLLQMIVRNDEEALTCRPLWSDKVYAALASTCQQGLDLTTVFDALRGEAVRRELVKVKP